MLILVLPILLGLLYLAIQCCFCNATSLRSTHKSMEFKYTLLLFLKLLLYRVSHVYKYNIVILSFEEITILICSELPKEIEFGLYVNNIPYFFVTIFKRPPIHTPLNNANILIFVDMVLFLWLLFLDFFRMYNIVRCISTRNKPHHLQWKDYSDLRFYEDIISNKVCAAEFL